MDRDLKGWELLNDKQRVVGKSSRVTKTSHMHWDAQTNIGKNPENIIHCGINEISKDANPEKIAAYIIKIKIS